MSPTFGLSWASATLRLSAMIRPRRSGFCGDDLDLDQHGGIGQSRDYQQSRGRVRLADELVARGTIGHDEAAVGQEAGDLDDILVAHATGLQHLADVLPDLDRLLVEGRLQLAARIDADLARDIKKTRACRQLGAVAV